MRVPSDTSDEQLLALVYGWIDTLVAEDYATAAAEFGYALSFGAVEADCILDAIQRYRSPEFFPDVETFRVSPWQTAVGGNPARRERVTRFKPNDVRIVASVELDLPLNGQWSDLQADFVLFETGSDQSYALCLEEISSWRQVQREAGQSDSVNPRDAA